jgi:hypothetical protein
MRSTVKLLSVVAASAAFSVVAVPAFAHFIWVRFVPGTSGRAEVVFTEEPHEKTTEALMAKLSGIQLKSGGKALPLKPADGGLTAAAGSAEVVYGHHSYGIFRDDTLLEYHYKASASTAGAAKRVPLELDVTVVLKGSSAEVTVERGRRRVADAEVTVHLAGSEKPLTDKTGAEGRVTFPVGSADRMGVRVLVREEKPGMWMSTPYKRRTLCTTLTLPLSVAR